MSRRTDSPDPVTRQVPPQRRSAAGSRPIRALLATFALVPAFVLCPPCVSAGDGEHPGPGEKIVRSTVGTAPQTLTATERAKLATTPAIAPAPVSVLRPAPWLPPGWRAQLVSGGTVPTRAATPRRNLQRAAPSPAAARAIGGPPAHVAPRTTKPPAVRTIGYGPRDATPAEIDSKRAATSKPGGGR